MKSWLDYKILDNTVESYLWFGALVLAAFILKRYLSKLVNYILYRAVSQITRGTEIKRFQQAVLNPMEWLLMFIVISLALETLTYPGLWNIKIFDTDLHLIIDHIMWAIILIAFCRVLLRIVDFTAIIMIERATKNTIQN